MAGRILPKEIYVPKLTAGEKSALLGAAERVMGGFYSGCCAAIGSESRDRGWSQESKHRLQDKFQKAVRHPKNERGWWMGRRYGFKRTRAAALTAVANGDVEGIKKALRHSYRERNEPV